MTFTRKGKLCLVAIGILVLLSTRIDEYHFTQSDYAAGSHSFSIVQWELRHLPLKWTHLLWELYPGNKPVDFERNSIVHEYLSTTLQLQKEQDNLADALTTTPLIDSASKNYIDLKNKEVVRLSRKREELRGRAEEAIEAAVSRAANNHGLGFTFGILLPPTDFRLGDPPHLLIISRRDKIVMSDSKLINPNLKWSERAEIENRAELYENTSALVDDLAGLGTYPAIVSDKDSLRQIMRTAAHEWLHNYWIMKPLGRNMWDSQNMQILNETAADLVGNELGDEAFTILGNDIENAYKYDTFSSSNPHLFTILRETRINVEEMLKNGNIEEAEKYMRKQLWNLKLGGYNIRKLNQAYFAFRGNYAEGPASISPIGSDLRELRDYYSTLGEFIESVSKIGNFEQFHYLLNLKRKEYFLNS
ncbi:MAG: hypothetical protein CL765_05370 [Chloroflexi bacterium]|nr:hypothetical protein [Chloroflexota bacterium]|tara:strand:- start:1037 stop:2290 length:1254 start_codon:yes stop_codon:yes gene_type:complete